VYLGILLFFYFKDPKFKRTYTAWSPFSGDTIFT
jgi:hypothetical protein